MKESIHKTFSELLSQAISEYAIFGDKFLVKKVTKHLASTSYSGTLTLSSDISCPYILSILSS